MAGLQDKLYAQDKWALLLIFQAMDAAGKDGAIKHVMSGVNPQGCQVFSFKSPSAEELDHDYLWRCMKVTAQSRPHRHFQPQLLRRDAGGAGAPGIPGEAENPAVAGGQEHLEATVRGHPPFRAVPGAQRRGGAEVLPPPLEEGTEAAVSGTHRQRRQRTGSSRPATPPSASIGTNTWRLTKT